MPRVLLWVLALAACHRDPPPPPPAGAPGDLRFVPPVYTDAATVTVTIPNYRDPGKLLAEDTSVAASSKTFMIVSERATATQIGHDVLASGGTAVDAAVATAFALAVVHPAAVGIGGGGVAIVRTAPGKAIALDFRAAGFVGGLAHLHGKHGKKPWRDLVAPAIALAREGVAIDKHTARVLAEAKDALLASPASAALWTTGGAVHDEGAKVAQPALSATLEKLANQPTALGKIEPKIAEPRRFTYRTHAIVTLASPGGALLATTAEALAASDVGSFAWHGKDHVDALAEVWKRAVKPSTESSPASQLSIVDRTGLAVAITFTLGAPFGTGETIEGGYFRARDPDDNAPFAPYLVESANGEVVIVGGAGGGFADVTAAWQTISNVVDFAHRGSLAVNNPRVHYEGTTLFVEDHAIDRDTETKLVELGHSIDWNREPRSFGNANAIVRTKTGWDAAADTRSGGRAMGD